MQSAMKQLPSYRGGRASECILAPQYQNFMSWNKCYHFYLETYRVAKIWSIYYSYYKVGLYNIANAMLK